MKAVEFFCGAGGTSTGLERAGIKILHAYDYWYPVVRVYRKNVSFRAFAQDIKDVFWLGQSVARQKVEIIVGSPPCQDFSRVGGGREGLNARLTHAYAMLVAIARPEWFLMENVPEATKSKAWRESRAILVRQGYGLTEMVLNASRYGVPQSRKRLIVVGRLGEQNGFLSSALAGAASEQPTTVRDMLLPDFPDDEALRAIGYYFARPYTGGRGVRSLDEPCPSVVRTTREAPGPKYRRAPHPKDPIPAQKAHVLTQAQVSRIQGFPPEWDWAPIGSSARDIDQAIANAVPPALAEAVGKVIVARNNGETIPAVEGHFVQWLGRQGKSPRVALNTKASLNRARKLLGGRTFADRALEVARLETANGFEALPRQTKSDLRSALRLHAEWQADASNKRSSA